MVDLRLGARIGGANGATTADRHSQPVTLDSADLTTHGVIVGMTGSGKTGLGVVLLEEVLSAGIPALILDPKGDMGNLSLAFPDLAPESFRPWVNEDDARRAGKSPDDFAAVVAKGWRDGLESQGIGPDRIAAFREAADFAVFTPGSAAGIPLNVIGSLAAPALSWEAEAETLRDEIEGTVTSLLGLLAIPADPLASREFVLLSNLIENAWRAGRSLDLATLIGQVQAPPLRKLGVFDIDTFFPPRDRTELAMKLNALVASPSFAAWGQGQPLDVGALLRTAEGKPRAAIVYLAHLSEDERQFVVALVLAKLVTWMRGQAGTSDLRALVYMDEVFGFVPPTAAPPAKKPILTILKQGRAFGVGMVLATQNPVDVDYKVMANASTWMVGRLQTENDKARVLEGLKSAAGTADVSSLSESIGGLQKRQFMLVSAKATEPLLFSTRWAMSYLAGPLTKDQIAVLMRPKGAAIAEPPAAETADAAVIAVAADATPVAPPVADGVPVLYLSPAAPWAAQVGVVAGGQRLRAFLAARVQVRFDDASAGVDEQEEYEAVYGPLDEGFDIEGGRAVDYDDRDFATEAPAVASYVLPGVPIGDSAFFRDAGRDIKHRLTGSLTLDLPRNRTLKLVGRPGESAEDFARRCDEAGQAAADAEAAKIRDRLEARGDRLRSALQTAQRRVEELTEDERSRQTDELVAGAGEVLGALFGGRRSTRSIAKALGGASSRHGRSSRTAQRRETAETKVEQAEDDLRELEQEIVDDMTEIDAKWQALASEIDSVVIRPEASDVQVVRLALVWVASD